MVSIYSSKMFKSSKHQDKILSAINSPINKELVMQLKDYVDIPETQKLNNIEPGKDTDNEKDSKSKTNETANNESKQTHTNKSSNPSDTSKSENIDVTKDEEVEDVDTKESNSEKSEETSTSTEENTNSSIKSTTAVYPVTYDNLISQMNVLKGTLNSNQTTAGVNRITIKDSEVWIYYNDEINLNSIMTPVIDLLHLTEYNYLTFNRLARSNNAIVFEYSIDISNVGDNSNGEKN